MKNLGMNNTFHQHSLLLEFYITDTTVLHKIGIVGSILRDNVDALHLACETILLRYRFIVCASLHSL